MTTLTAAIAGIGFWATGLPDWHSARAFARTGLAPDAAPSRPSPQVLAPNERRRAPDTVAVALDVALAACTAAGRDPATLPSVFASTHGDLGITDYMCSTLADAPRAISPTRFHNSVHNAAAGYWTIGAGCTQATTAISAYDATFAEGLLEALVQLAAGEPAVLLVAYDGAASGPLAPIARSAGLLGGALVLARDADAHAPLLHATLIECDSTGHDGRLAQLCEANAMRGMLPLFDALADDAHAERHVDLHAGPGRTLRVTIERAQDRVAHAPVAGVVAHA